MNISTKNLNKPSSRKWKKVADILLYTLPLYLTTILALPLSENATLWINFGVTMTIVTLKAFTKFTSDET